MSEAVPVPFATTDFVTRFSSRQGRLAHVFLKDRLKGAKRYIRIAGYFRSSIFELVHEEISDIDEVLIVCNSDLDPRDIEVAQASEAYVRQAVMQKWNEGESALDSLVERGRYARLYELLKKGNVKIKVVSREDAPFLHGKAGVVTAGDETRISFIGSINETAQGWMHSYEIVWEDRSSDGADWIEAEFAHLWSKGRWLPEAVVEEIGRCARKVQVNLADLDPDEVGRSAVVESPLYRRGEELTPWQRAFVALFVKHRETYGKCRLLLADEVGVGKTLSMAMSGMISALLGDGPVLILCPATLGVQWQVELLDKLAIPSALWLSSKKMWLDPYGRTIRTRGPQDVARCPYQVGIVSTGLITQGGEEGEVLLRQRFGMVILDEGHKARKKRALGEDPVPGNLYRFMWEIALQTTHMIIGTATPIQTDVAELWDLLEILNRGANHVLGRTPSFWRDPEQVRPLLTGAEAVLDEDRAWSLIRNPMPPREDGGTLFDLVYMDLGIETRGIDWTDRPLTDLDRFTRDELADRLSIGEGGLGFFQYHNPISRHVVLRRRKTLEDAGLLPKIAVDIWPMAEDPNLALFEGKALRTSPEFDEAYAAVERFTAAMGKRTKGAGFMKNLLRQRICSSVASGLSTCRKLIENRRVGDSDLEDEFDEILMTTPGVEEAIDLEIDLLRSVVSHLASKPTDPKLDACVYYLDDRGWLEDGCIVFSQYYDTAHWIAKNLSAQFPNETVAVYGGAGRSGVFLNGEWRTVNRDDIKKAVAEYRLRLVIATDAACEGLNLQTLASLINVDLPWNPSRLEQRIGRIKRYGQRRDRVRMANLVYQGTVDERVYDRLSERMRDRYDLLGSLPDTIEDDWIDDVEAFEEALKDFTRRRRSTADVFELRYGNFLESRGEEWKFCERVLDQDEAQSILTSGWQ